MRFFALAERPWINDDLGGSWGLPAGTVNQVDLSAPGATDRVFVTSDKPFAAGTVIEQFGDGSDDIGKLRLNGRSRAAWERLTGTRFPTDGTLLDALWSALVDQSDPEGGARAKPIMPTSHGRLELHLGGVARSQRLPRDVTTHPAWSRMQKVFQDDYARVEARDPELARKVLGATQIQYRLTPEAARDLLIPAGLPRVLPLKPTTTYTESFPTNGAITSGQNLTWVVVFGAWSVTSNKATEATTGGGDVANSVRAEHDLSSANHSAQIVITNLGNNVSGGTSVRHASGADTRYSGALGESTSFNTRHLYKIIAGAQTALIADRADSGVNGDVVKVQADGSSISLWKNGVQTGSTQTDTDISGNTRTGLVGKKSIRLDDFEATDLVVAPSSSSGGLLLRGVG